MFYFSFLLHFLHICEHENISEAQMTITKEHIGLIIEAIVTINLSKLIKCLVQEMQPLTQQHLKTQR